jgi:hypothetical protein
MGVIPIQPPPFKSSSGPLAVDARPQAAFISGLPSTYAETRRWRHSFGLTTATPAPRELEQATGSTNMSLQATTTTVSRPRFRTEASSAPAAVDPIFALIENHREQHAAHGIACEGNNDRETDRARNATYTLAMRLVKAPATTLAGVAAVLRYGHEFVRAGNEWPNWLNNAAFDWSANLNKSAAAAIERIAKL